MKQDQKETIKQLEKQIEFARKHAKKQNKEYKAFMATNLRAVFDKQLTKHQDKTQQLNRELKVIAHQKQKYGQ
ncbi:hypothetical protein [endosymbiont GvMRE of Glomus versiforme]|uniref:hypothetical protein n=1 Tax=endosymbiont GvMRE of Glomus versiforme TaxID=2039283 RepID=UPI000EBAEE71|nr:hypothetical protein [endosymbiont GvMRE of Glomus versiforme]RHZ37237.1 hypothetical protein GvMRE_I1g266 [endosymbiont GvMRE of Glomus versiforme]